MKRPAQRGRGAPRAGGKARARPATRRAASQRASTPSKRPPRAVAPPQPTRRLLRGYAFDPQLSTELESAAINEIVYEVPWELKLEPGPRGDYLDVIDYDPASGSFYPPVDLDDRALLAQNGLTPSEANPQFHQQMVYAVAMRTIEHFEHALGRRVLWSPRRAGRPRRRVRRSAARLPTRAAAAERVLRSAAQGAGQHSGIQASGVSCRQFRLHGRMCT